MGSVKGGGVVAVRLRDEADARVEGARHEPGLGKLQEGVMDGEAHGAAVGQHGGDGRRGAVGGEGQHRLDLGVAGEGARALETQRGPGHVLLPIPLLRLPQGGHDEGVAQDEVGGVHEEALAFFGHDVEGGQDGRGERLFHDPRALLVGDAAAVEGLPLLEQHPRPHARETHEAQLAELPTVEGYLEQSRPAGQAHAIEELEAGADLEE